MMSLTFGLFTQVSGSGPLGPLVEIVWAITCTFMHGFQNNFAQLSTRRRSAI